MRVRTDHQPRATIAPRCQRSLLTGRFHVRFNNQDGTALRNRSDHFINGSKWIIGGKRKEDAPQHRAHIDVTGTAA